MTSLYRHFFGVTLFLIIGLPIHNLNAQSFRFKTFDSNVGLPQNFVYCITQDHSGFIWMGTGEGLVRYNGLNFESFIGDQYLADDFISALFVAPDGKLWIGHNNGNLTTYSNGKFKPIQLPETQSPVQAICSTPDKTIWALTQNHGLIKMDPDGENYQVLEHPELRRKLFYSIAPLGDSILMVGTSEGLFRVGKASDNQITFVEHVEGLPITKITSILPRKGLEGEFWIGTEDNGFFRYSDAQHKSSKVVDNNVCQLFNIQHENIQDIEEEPGGNLLLATWGNGVIKLIFDPVKRTFVDSYNFNTTNGLNENFVKDILCDRENNYWFATYGGGSSLLVNDYMIYYNLETIGFENNKVKSVFRTDSVLWLGLESGLLKTDPYCFTNFEYYDNELGIPNDEISGFYKSPDGTMFVASANKGLFYRKGGEMKFKPWSYTPTLPGRKIRDIAGKDFTIYLATYGGFFILDLKSGTTKRLTTENGLPHNSINFVYVSPSGEIWIGPKSSGVSKVTSNHIEIHKILQLPVDVYDMVEDDQGVSWLATQGRGVLRYTADSIKTINVTSGLAKNFCYSLQMDLEGRLWVAHFPGMSMINTRTDVVKTFGYEQSMGYDFHQIWSDKDQTLWFASGKGVIHYLPLVDQDNMVPPVLNFTDVVISDKEYDPHQKIDLPYPYGKKYHFKFNFIGVSIKNPTKVNYQYQLVEDGHEESAKWIDLGTTNYREYDFLPSGRYHLNIRAFNANGIGSEPISLAFNIAIPFWKMTWFYLVATLLFVYILYLIIMFRERSLRLQKEQLQKEVDFQTVQLRQQKAEIEKKNQDITDSINYAKHIQKSILPALSTLQSYFPNSFVFFVPRDIVSGDFYWFYKTPHSFIICCADCTGHGVPAALMSMIGTTLLNDIVRRESIKSPADILEQLDHEIKILLQHDNNALHNHDGMDISVVEINLKSRKIRAASAKRPIYLFLNEEMVIYKGNRRSIGDSLVKENSPFVNIEYQGLPNDLIYLFSDGYTDQFGGPMGKKFMTGGVKNLLKKIHHRPTKEQHKIIRDHFFNWKGDLEQIDDVLFMGVRL